MFYNNKEYKKFDDNYFVSKDGDVYSTYKKGTLKHYIDTDGYHRVDIHSKHMKVHKLVFLVWIGVIPDGMQINHKDDNKDNNNYLNLYAGTQKENILDCIRNGTRKGHIKNIKVFDKKIGSILEFDSIKKFLLYTGHTISNGSLSHVIDKVWFKERFEVI